MNEQWELRKYTERVSISVNKIIAFVINEGRNAIVAVILHEQSKEVGAIA